jgi:ribonuclease HII
MMVELANQHPQYGWEKNKGYGSRLHRDALKTLGMTPWHRRVFCENLMRGEYGDALDAQFDDYFQDAAVPLLV